MVYRYVAAFSIIIFLSHLITGCTKSTSDTREREVQNHPTVSMHYEVDPDLPAPTDLVVSEEGGAILLRWRDQSTTEDGFAIFRKSSSGEYSEIAVVGGDSSSYLDRSILQRNETYFYLVRAVHGGTASEASNEVNLTIFQLPVDAPQNPRDLAASVLSSSQIKLTWIDESQNESGFKMERSSDGGSTFIEIEANLSDNVTEFFDTGLLPNTSYSYRIRSYIQSQNGPVFSGYSATVQATTESEIVVPALPSDLVVTAPAYNEVRLTWVDNSSNEDGFIIERAIGNGSFVEIASGIAPNTTSYVDLGLAQSTDYSYRIRAFAGPMNRRVYSDYAISQAVQTPADPGQLAVPQNITTEQSGRNITINFVYNGGQPDGFKIYRKVGDDPRVQIGSNLGVDVRSYIDENVLEDVGIQYTVSVFRNYPAEELFSQPILIVIRTAPRAPTGFQAIAISHKQIDLSWQDNATNEAGYRISRSEDNLTFVDLPEAVFLSPNSTSFSDRNLIASKRYFYRVLAINNIGESAYASAEATTQPLPPPPAAPILTGGVVFQNDQGRISLNWEAQNASSFKVYRKNSDSDYSEVASTSGDVRSYMDGSAVEEAAYSYKISASNDGGSTDSNEISAVILRAPRNLTVSVLSTSEVALSWEDSSAFNDGIIVERSNDSGLSYAPIITLNNPTAASYVNSSLSSNTTYYYRVRGFRGANNFSLYSSIQSATTLPDKPSIPTGVISVASSDFQIGISWNHDGLNVTGFKIFRTNVQTLETVNTSIAGSQIRFYLDSGLAERTTYSYYIIAHGLGGESNGSTVVQATTLDASHPGAPSSLTAIATEYNRIRLTWQDNSTNENGFEVWRKTASSTIYNRIQIIESPNTTSFIDTYSLTEHTTYDYQVRARNNGGFTFYSDPARVTTLYIKPLTPSALTAVAQSQTSIALSWNDNSSNENKMEIYRSSDGGSTFTLVVTLGANVERYTDTDLQALRTYHYKVVAKRFDRASESSNLAFATTLPNPPTAPANLVAVATHTRSIHLSWSDNSNNETGFEIFRKVGTGSFALIFTAPANTIVYDDTYNLYGNNRYEYKVRAAINSVKSSDSNSAAVQTLSAPSSLVAALPALITGLSHKQINLSWADNSSTEVGFKIERSTDNITFVLVGTVGLNIRSFQDTENVLSAQKYYYRVKAHNGSGHSSYSLIVSQTTNPTPPGSAGDLRIVQVSSNAATLQWVDNSTNENDFKIERSLDCVNYTEIAQVGLNVTSYSDTSLIPNTRYCYRVRAHSNNGGDGAYSNIASTKTQP